jgi:agmatine/peptidylarginine deiminase
LKLLAAKERELQQLGFRVIRVPHLFADAGDWPGVSYINHLRVGRTLFVPALGLPQVEDRIFAGLRRKLGASYEVIPIPARSGLLNNGGVHCVFGIVPELSKSASK